MKRCLSVAAGTYAGFAANKAITVQGEAGPRPDVILPPGATLGVGNVSLAANNVTISHLRVQKTDTSSDTYHGG